MTYKTSLNSLFLLSKYLRFGNFATGKLIFNKNTNEIPRLGIFTTTIWYLLIIGINASNLVLFATVGLNLQRTEMENFKFDSLCKSKLKVSKNPNQMPEIWRYLQQQA
jgi:hypothetical protein